MKPRPLIGAGWLRVAAALLFIAHAQSIRWLALRHSGLRWNATSSCRRAPGLTRRQSALCRDTADAMPHVVQAAAVAGAHCQLTFANRRWNCSSIDLAPEFTADLTTGTREQAFVYAVSSAAVVFTVARACAQGSLFHCACAAVPRDPPNGDFKWGGCGDNSRWAGRFARQFTDSAERRAASAADAAHATHATHDAQPPTVRGIVRRHRQGFHDDLDDAIVGGAKQQLVFGLRSLRRNGEQRDAGRGGGAGVGGGEKATPPTPQERQRRRVKATLAAVNLHNNRAGRRAVQASLSTQCKCHGVSGSCNVKTCWRALPRFSETAARLQRRFAAAAEVASRRVGAGRKLLPTAPAPSAGTFTQDELVFVTRSPDFCLRNDKLGSLGTRGRTCNATARGYGSCDEMCCGRGFRTLHVERVERCQCKYYWCCYVRCNTCRRWAETHECY